MARTAALSGAGSFAQAVTIRVRSGQEGIGFRESIRESSCVTPCKYGGERGIRTPDSLLDYSRFPGVRIKPLCHLSTGWETVTGHGLGINLFPAKDGLYARLSPIADHQFTGRTLRPEHGALRLQEVFSELPAAVLFPTANSSPGI